MKKIVGYTAGAYDMFHIGHLNLLRRAKEQCDYLIVGVNSDKLIEKYKNKKTIIPQDERIEIIKAIKYVDDVILVENRDKMIAYNKYKFDKLFVGDDWKGSEIYKETENDLKKYGSEVIYLPYTKNTSSTVLREALNTIIGENNKDDVKNE